MINRQRTVAFCHRRLPHLITTERAGVLRCRQRGKRFAGVHLSRRSDRLDPGRAAHVRSAVITTPGDRVFELVNWPGVKRDSQIQLCAQTFFRPIRFGNGVRQLERKFARDVDVIEHKIQAVAPRIVGDDRSRKSSRQSRN